MKINTFLPHFLSDQTLTSARRTIMNVLVTGSSRGLGLELVKQLATRPDSMGGVVVATARKCSPGLQELISSTNGSVVFVALDVTDRGSIAQSASQVRSVLAGRSLDLLINCAGVHSETDGKIANMYEAITFILQGDRLRKISGLTSTSNYRLM